MIDNWEANYSFPFGLIMLKRILYFYSIALPIALQNLILSSKSFVDTYLLTLSSSESVAAVGIASKILLVAFIIISGISTGSGYVMSQNAEKNENISYATRFTIKLGLGISLLIMSVIFYLKKDILSYSSNNDTIVSLSSLYIDMILPTLLLVSTTSTISNLIRIKGDYKTPSYISIFSVIINVFLSFILIENFSLGVQGAAYGTIISSILELILTCIFFSKRFTFDFNEFPKAKKLKNNIYRQAFVSSSSGIVWAVGVSTFYILLGTRGQDVLYIISVISPIEALVLSFTIGLSISTGIEIGKSLPLNNKGSVVRDAYISMLSSFIISFLIAMLLFFSKSIILSSFNLYEISGDSEMFFNIMIISVFIKSLSIQLMNGVIRAGGDGAFCLRCDFIFQWIFTIPLVWFLNTQSVDTLLIYSFVVIEELLKLIVSAWRFYSGKWYRDLAA